MSDQENESPPAKKKKTFLLKKRIEDAQNYTKSKDQLRKTVVPQSEGKGMGFAGKVNKSMTKIMAMAHYSQKTESVETEPQEKTTKSKALFESKPTFCLYEVQGPQLKINKRFLSFLVKTGLVATESIEVSNNGSTAIYYEWTRLEKSFLIGSSLKDSEERFYCHHKKNVIKPGETISFKFSFLSKVTGIFDEEWVLNCEPHLIDPLPKIKFSGQAIIDDLYIKWREDLSGQLDKSYIVKNISEIVQDIIAEVRTPTPPLPDLENPEVCEHEYEDKNYKNRLYYSSVVVSFLRNMEKELYEEQQMNPEEQYWDMNVDYIKRLIAEVKEEENKVFFDRKFTDIYQLSRFRPYQKSPIYYYVRSMVSNLCRNIPDLSQTTRKECDMWEYSFKEPPTIDLTEEEIKKKKEEEAKIKADWLKKAKKKKFTEEDEKKLVEDYRQKLSQKCGEYLLDQFSGFEDMENYIAVYEELNRKRRPDGVYFESLGKKKCLRDFDLDGRRVMIRVNLKLGETKEAIAKKEEHENNIIHAEELRRLELERLERERIEEEKRKKRGRGIVKKKNKKEEEEAARLAEERKKLEEEKKKEVPFLEPENLEDIIETIKLCLEKMAKLVIILVSYDKPRARYSQIHSVKFFEEFLQNKIEQSNIIFSESTVIPDFLEKVEQDEYPENSILILENVYFQPEEVGFHYGPGDKMTSLSFEEKLDYIGKMSEYASLYVIEDKPDLFKKWTSLSNFRAESCALGVNSGKELSVISYAMVVEKEPVVFFIGGEITPFKLLMIDSVLNIADEIWLVGKLGLYFKMYNEKMEHFCGLHLDDFKKKIIERLYKSIVDMNIMKSMPKSLQPNLKIAEIRLPCDFKLTDLSNEEEELEIPDQETPEFVEFVRAHQRYHCFLSEEEVKEFKEKEHELNQKEEEERALKQKLKEQKEGNEDEELEEKNEEELQISEKRNTSVHENENIQVKETSEPQQTTPIPKNEEPIEQKPIDLQKEGLFLMDFGEITQKKLIRSIKNCKKLVWIDSLCPNNDDNFNQTNFEVSTFLYHYQDEKKSAIQKEKETPDGNHDFNEDRIVFAIGKQLEQKINAFDLIDPLEIKPTSQKDENEENKSQAYENEKEENKSQASGQGNVPENKRNNIGLISDFYAKDSDFACKILSGRYPYGLTLVEEWEIKEGSEDEENFSFVDEI